MTTQQRQSAARMSTGGNILSRMLQLEKQSKQSRNSSTSPASDGNSSPLSMNPPIAAVSAVIPAAALSPPKKHAPASPAVVRHSHSVAPAPPSSPKIVPRIDSEYRPKPPPKPALNHSLAKPGVRPLAMSRSQTVPSLSIDVQLSESKNPTRASKTKEADDDELPAEICQSPSWSDYGGAKRKKEKRRQEKERKEEEKRMKKEAKLQLVADLKAGKRLSKRQPPAAMETQKMPAALRRNSIISFISSPSSSGDNTQREARDEKRLSADSTDSTKGTQRSRSTPATSTEIRSDISEGCKHVVSPVAPQLPRLSYLEWQSRRGSSGTDQSKSWGSEDAYEKELVNFAYQFQASAVPSSPKDIILDNVRVNQVTVQPSLKHHSGAWRMDRTKTDSDLTALKNKLKVKDLESLPATLKRESQVGKPPAISQANHRGGHADMGAVASKIKNAETRPEEHYTQNKGDKALPSTTDQRWQKTNAPGTQGRPVVDGSSYVHKQRMHQQQLCIAGFEDEQAMRIANERLAEQEALNNEAEEPVHATPEADPHPQPEVPSTPPECALQSKRPPTTQRPRQDEGGKDSGNSLDAQLPVSSLSRSSRVDKFLGLTRRQRPEHQKHPSTSKALVAPKASRTSPPPSSQAVSPLPMRSSPQATLESVKAQKAIETPLSARQHRRSEIVELIKPDEATEERKPVSVANHSRTRTSSSQLLNEDMPMHRPLPRSSTAPNLSPEMKLPSAVAGRNRNESPSSSGRKSVTFGRTIAGPPSEAPKIEAFKVETSKVGLAAAKMPEIIVESVSPEGLIRKTSIKRPRSNPNLQLAVTNAQLPSLDFLPQLKHQPLPKRSPKHASFMPSSPERPASSQFPARVSFPLKPTPDSSTGLSMSSSSPNLHNPPGSPLRPESYAGPSSPGGVSLRPIEHTTRRRTMSPSSTDHSSTGALGSPHVFGRNPTASESVNAKPIAKLFVICCKCNYWHDLPSHLYEAMCSPKNLTRDPRGTSEGPKEIRVVEGKKKVAEATLETMVKCPWCEHFMTIRCCAGWTTVLYLQERHH
ncbi:MAG: hypothetical protein L6R35_001446 [Caloplaca aegaea]|nr:MAG: hypothetical protein L6R35_001446 [Caloplaca aegaea]